jgi:hypothetical protein
MKKRWVMLSETDEDNERKPVLMTGDPYIIRAVQKAIVERLEAEYVEYVDEALGDWLREDEE